MGKNTSFEVLSLDSSPRSLTVSGPLVPHSESPYIHMDRIEIMEQTLAGHCVAYG